MAEGDGRGGSGRIWSFPLFEALLRRRSRRFALGMRMNGGPLAYESRAKPVPLSLEEEAALAFAGAGITGITLGELPYTGDRPGTGGGTIITSFLGRTAAAPDAIHSVALAVINDDGAFLLRRPIDLPRSEVTEIVRLAGERKLEDVYRRMRRQIASVRPDIPRENPFNLAFNQWSANRPGTTYFLPINDLTPLYLNVLLSALSEEFGYYVVDDRAGFRPAGLAQFARSRGGHLEDDPRAGRTVTISFFETWIAEFIAIEQGMVLQNLALAAEAMGLGGFPHFSAHPFAWFQALGFRMEDRPLSRALCMGRLTATALKFLRRDFPIPFAIGLERAGETLLRPYAPPYFPDMGAALRSFLDLKYSRERGSFRDGGAMTKFKDPVAIQAGIPEASDRTVAAVTACLEYIRRRYGSIPATMGPFRTALAYQAHHLDLEFYDKFYRPEAIPDAQRSHLRDWHPGA